MALEETYLQQRCKRWFDQNYPEYKLLFYAVPNGAEVSDKQRKKLFCEGMTAGVSDMKLDVPSVDGKYHTLGVEFKRETYETKLKDGRMILKKGHTTQSKEQKAWQAAFESAGNKYVVVWTDEMFQKAITDYIGPSKVVSNRFNFQNHGK